MQDQIRLNERLAIHTDGYLLPLFAYNPWTATVDGGESLALLEDAAVNRSFIGVKIYPPIGYYPSGNSTPRRYPNRSKAPNLEELDKELYRLYDKCIDLDIPVIAHGNHSMGAEANHKPMGGPLGWRELLSNPRYQELRVNIGHFGGNFIDCSSRTWTEQFIDIMSKSSRLYGDIGYWNELANGDAAEVQNFKQLLNTDIGSGELASDRILFGTDWLMLSREQDWHHYAGSLYSAFKGADIGDSTINRFFSQNSMALFGMNKKDQNHSTIDSNRSRLFKHYEKHNIQAEWIKL
jgi:predicted TIM-barrel fold metal-dependent hydrolase